MSSSSVRSACRFAQVSKSRTLLARLLNDVRTRLESLATSSQSASTAASSIQASEANLNALVTEHAATVESPSAAKEVAVKTLTAVQTAAEASDLSHIAQQLQELQAANERINSHLQQLSDINQAIDAARSDIDKLGKKQAKQSTALTDIRQDLEEIKAAIQDSASTSKDVEAKDVELEALRKAVDRVIGNLPSRFQSRFRESISGR